MPLAPRPPSPRDVPDAVRGLLETLAAAGHPSFLVGGCVRDLLLGSAPADWDVTTAASAEQLLALFPGGVPIGIRHGTVMVPSEAGPIDVTHFRAGPAVEDDLAHRDFTIDAIAWDPLGGRLVDPFEGAADLGKGRLRAVRSARDRLAEDPLRALRAARLRATLELEVDPELVDAMSAAVPALAGVARERIRRELSALLLGSAVAEGLRLLRRTGLEAQLAPGVAGDAPALVAALPARLELRLAGWLRGTRASAILRGLRFPRRTGDSVSRLLRLHPVDQQVDPGRDGSVRRCLRRVGGDFADLVKLRRAELERAGPQGGPDRAALGRLEQLDAAVARVRRAGHLALRRQDLAVDGDFVMRVIGGPPGPHIGRALRHLTLCVVDDPTLNTPERLRELLEAWAREELRPTV